MRDRYRLVERLSQRGGSSTWQAVDTANGSRCVVKELDVGEVVRQASGALSYDGDDFTKLIDLFEREARVLSHLELDAVPRLLDHFRLEEGDRTRLYSVQEHIEGATLEELVDSGRHFTEEDAREICRRLLEVLDDLHGRSPPLIHRDIKPSNVILDEGGAVHLVDFGSVRTLREPDVLDGKTIVGTYGYMPIEQYEGRAVPQSDFYALGMTLVHVLSHKDPTRIPRSGLTLAFREHVNVSDHFADILEWMIEPVAEDRPADARTLLEALEHGPAVAASGRRSEEARLAHMLAGLMTDLRTRRVGAAALGAFAAWMLLVLGLASLPMIASWAGVAPGRHEGRPEASTGAPGPAVAAVAAVDGILDLDLDRHFEYVARGWPMGRSVGQTTLPALTPEPRTPLVLAGIADGADRLLFGQIVLGNARDNRFDFALVERRGVWALHLDRDNDEDLSNDGPALDNEGNGPLFATSGSVDVPVWRDGSERAVRPYAFWTWFSESSSGGTPYGRFYARSHYRGAVEIGGERFEATAFEYRDHDALYRDDGVCVDLNRDGTCQEEDELFYDGDVIAVSGEVVRLVLSYP